MEDSTILTDILETVTFIKDNAVMRDEFIQFKGEFSEFKKEITEEVREMKSVMVTKDYLDTKLADLRGDLVSLVRREDTKVNTLITQLHTKDILKEKDMHELSKAPVFPTL